MAWIFWSCLGIAILSESNIIKLARSFYWKEEEESMENCSFMFVLHHLEIEK